MKKYILVLLLFLSCFVNAQKPMGNYHDLWEKVYQDELELLPKSSLEKVDKIYAKAVQEQNEVQKIKCLLYQSKFALALEENATLKIVNNFKSAIQSAQNKEAKAVLNSLLAHMYWDYLKKYKWSVYHRTQTLEIVNNDFRTWDLNTLYAKIHQHFRESLKDRSLLKNIAYNDYSELIQQYDGVEKEEATLFDFLAHQALAFYQEKESSITQPKEPFLIDQEEYLTAIETYDFTSKDTLSTKYLSLKLYQELIQFHKKNSVAYFKTLLQAVDYIENNADLDDFKNLKLSFLKGIQQKISPSKARAFIDFEIAKTYYEFGETYDSLNTKHQYGFIKALEVCNQLVTKYPEHEQVAVWKELIAVIELQEMSCLVEQYVPIGQQIKALVKYRNVTAFYGTIYKPNQKEYQQIKNEGNAQKKDSLIKLLPVYTSCKSDLINIKDHQKHSAEIVLPKVPQGQYILVGGFQKDVNNIDDVFFQVTNLTLLKDQDGSFQVLDRMRGYAYENAEVYLENKPLNYKGYYRINKRFKTDKNGIFKTENNQYYRNVKAQVTTQTDTAYFENIYLYKQNEITQNKNTFYDPFIFTDRSIYRPGQKVFFKAIVLKKSGEHTELLSNETIEVGLYDVNNKEVKKISLDLNEFGTVAATFNLPTNGLNGTYSFSVFRNGKKIKYVSTRISVEAYKRPKFETSFKPVSETFKINDSVTVHGEATALSGSKITNAKVVYRVVRKARFPRWCWWVTPKSPIEIAQGTTTTNSQGEYFVKFKALPDASIAKKNQPIFYYTIYADVTDVNGETRSTETQVAIGYHTLKLELSVPNMMDVCDKNSISIHSENLNGQFVATQGNVKVYKLIAPPLVYRNRPWAQPDLLAFSKEVYKNLFPYESYQSVENDPKKWERGALVFSKEFSNKKELTVGLGKTKKWALGKYVVVAESKDKWGQLVKDKQIVTFYHPKAQKVADHQLFQISLDKEQYLPNDEVEVAIGSSAENITVFVRVEKNHKIIATHQIALNNQIKKIKIPVTEKDRGGFAIKWHRVNYNDIDSGVLNVVVPYKSTELNIETLTFRDLLEPGAAQKWSFKIKGTEQEKVMAEVLASMYDASLDQFKSHKWQFNPVQLPTYRTRHYLQTFNGFNTASLVVNSDGYRHFYHGNKLYTDEFDWFGFSFVNHKSVNNKYLVRIYHQLKGSSTDSFSSLPPPLNEVPFMSVNDDVMMLAKKEVFTGEFNMDRRKIATSVDSLEEVVGTLQGKVAGVDVAYVSKDIEQQLSNVKPRINFNETAFFFPQLKTDKNGEVSFEFTMPEDITRWKLQLMAHDKELNTAVKTLTTVTQKKLMVTPNAPRFLREGDAITLSTKIANLENDIQKGKVKLELTDVVTGKNIDALLQNNTAVKDFTVVGNGNTSVAWQLQIPENVSAVQYKIVAASKNYSDGEQNVIPVLSNRMLVTETLPLWVNGGETKTFTLERLKNNVSESLKHHQLTLEMTSNPAWYAVQALPYLMEYPYECSEQTFARYYANQLASYIIETNPKIKEVFQQWANSDALLSNLEKNQELKSIIIQETPWLRDAQSETEQKKRIALLFDLSKMQTNLDVTIDKLEKMQFSNGAFPWFGGSDYANRYVTQHILQGFKHLKYLGVEVNDKRMEKVMAKAQSFLDAEFLKDYERLLTHVEHIGSKEKIASKGVLLAKEYMSKNHLSSFQLQYLYIQSFEASKEKSPKLETAIAYYIDQSAKYWKEQSLYQKGLVALIQYRNNHFKTANSLVKSLEENSIVSQEMGMYWKENKAGWSWYQAPVETQSLMIEVFSEIKKDIKTTDNLKKWLLKNKQTQQWKTTKATTEAVYALLLQGSDWLAIDEAVEIHIGGEKLAVANIKNVKAEAGTGYFKTQWSSKEINSNMATISLTKKTKGVAWGGLYWQYFQDLDKVKTANTSLKINKKVFVKTNASNGPLLTEVKDHTVLKVGDLLTVRIELSTDRDMEFIHLKDMRASGLEPIDVLSGYKRQGRLGYYQTTKDASTHFFFDSIGKGIYVFEYDVRVSHQGVFSNGVTTIQSMYAPEFGSHSKGIRIEVK